MGKEGEREGEERGEWEEGQERKEGEGKDEKGWLKKTQRGRIYKRKGG